MQLQVDQRLIRIHFVTKACRYSVELTFGEFFVTFRPLRCHARMCVSCTLFTTICRSLCTPSIARGSVNENIMSESMIGSINTGKIHCVDDKHLVEPAAYASEEARVNTYIINTNIIKLIRTRLTVFFSNARGCCVVRMNESMIILVLCRVYFALRETLNCRPTSTS